jgi:hypothetical protein
MFKSPMLILCNSVHKCNNCVEYYMAKKNELRKLIISWKGEMIANVTSRKTANLINGNYHGIPQILHLSHIRIVGLECVTVTKLTRQKVNCLI